MRSTMKWGGVVALGLVLGFGCSASDVPSGKLADNADPGMAGADKGSAAGAGAIASVARAGGGGQEGRGTDVDAEAGASGACAGNYLCPAVYYSSIATITVDLPVTVAEAADATFTACRGTDCHTGKGSEQVNAHDPSFGWAEGMNGGTINLSFDGSGATPFAVLTWYFGDYAIEDPNTGEHYLLTVQRSGDAAPTTLFDSRINYKTVMADPSLVSEGYCRHCSEVLRGAVDARAAH